jgi:methylmalonyl-CoA mutase
VATFRNPNSDGTQQEIELARSTDEEKQSQRQRLAEFRARNAEQPPPALQQRLQQTAIENGNLFEVLMEAVRVCSLGQITQTLLEVGGRYRRSM